MNLFICPDLPVFLSVVSIFLSRYFPDNRKNVRNCRFFCPQKVIYLSAASHLFVRKFRLSTYIKTKEKETDVFYNKLLQQKIDADDSHILLAIKSINSVIHSAEVADKKSNGHLSICPVYYIISRPRVS